MDCREVKDSLSAYLDGVLDGLMESKIKKHIEKCQDCQEELDSLEMAIDFLKDGEEVNPPEDFRSNLRARLESIKDEEKILNHPKWLNRFKKHWLKVGSVAAAAILFLAIGLPSFTQKQQYEIATNQVKDADLQEWNFADGRAGKTEKGVASQDMVAEDSAGGSDMQMSQAETYGTQSEALRDGSGSEEQSLVGIAQVEPELANEVKLKSAAAPERKVITEGSVGLEVKSITKVTDKIVKLVESKNGFIQKTYFNEEQNGLAQLVLRVPKEDFEKVLESILKLGKVRFKETNGQDVTEEYLDIEARLITLKTQETRLLALTKEGENLEDILKIEKELQRVREDIEQLEGRIKVINDLAGLATLKVDLYQDSLVPATSSSIEAPGVKGVLQRMINAIIDSSNNLLNFFGLSVVFFGGALPYLVLLILVALGFYWAKKRYFNTKR